MFNWLRQKLGIVDLEADVACLFSSLARIEGDVVRVAKKTRTGRGPQRYDEIQRDRARRRKGKANADVF